jgi:hypothetical protein
MIHCTLRRGAGGVRDVSTVEEETIRISLT